MDETDIEIGTRATVIIADGTRYALRLSGDGGLYIRCSHATPGFRESITIEPEASNTILIRPVKD